MRDGTGAKGTRHPTPTRVEATILGQARITLRGGSVVHRESGAAVRVGHDPVVVGRAVGCDLRIADPKISARHCELVATEAGVLLRDLASRNGTWFCDARVGEVHLTERAQIVIGNSKFEFVPGPTAEQPLVRTFGKLESRAPKMQAAFERLTRFVRTSENIHLTGETGTGKGYIAERIHELSGRSGPFIKIDVASLSPTMIESELFGHVKGAFTGAVSSKESPFVLARGGTVFLDEIGDLPKESQTKLLRVCDDKVIQRVGSPRAEPVDVRVVSATLHDLEARVNRKEFRADLFERLGVIVHLPALRERKEDLSLIVRQILTDMGHAALCDRVQPSTYVWMATRPWDGNLRELTKVLRLTVEFFEQNGTFDVAETYRAYRARREERDQRADGGGDEGAWLESLIAGGASLEAVHEEATKRMLKLLATECDGKVARIAERAQIGRARARSWLDRFGLRASDDGGTEREKNG